MINFIGAVALILAVLVSPASMASGLITVDGVVTGFTKSVVMIKRKPYVMHVKRSEVRGADVAKLKNLKVGQKLALSVPFSAVERVVPTKRAPAAKKK